jgi:hypothetical protein
MEGWLIFIGIIVAIWIIGWLNDRTSKFKKQEKENKKKMLIDQMNNLVKEKNEALESLKNEHIKELEVLRKENIETLTTLNGEKSKGFPWLVQAYDDYFQLQDQKTIELLKSKSHPALKAAEQIRQFSKERREAEKAARLASYLLDYSRYLAPWLDDYIGVESSELDEIIKEIHSAWEKKEKEFDEEVKRHFGPKYEDLTPMQKLQKKLDWYWEKPNKSDWQIGHDYERYIGYLYEIGGWKVNYHGKKSFEDLGRDLICKKDNVVEIIQCKRWAQEKTIHEKHIYYLFGTTVEYYLDNFKDNDNLQLSLFPDNIKKRNVIPKLMATAKISDKAEQVAKVLGVEIKNIPFKSYPSVKCNVALRTGEKIFHLPFDQQYDTAQIEEEKLECYVGTISEAEDKGFRHAYRWKGENES